MQKRVLNWEKRKMEFSMSRYPTTVPLPCFLLGPAKATLRFSRDLVVVRNVVIACGWPTNYSDLHMLERCKAGVQRTGSHRPGLESELRIGSANSSCMSKADGHVVRYNYLTSWVKRRIRAENPQQISTSCQAQRAAFHSKFSNILLWYHGYLSILVLQSRYHAIPSTLA